MASESNPIQIEVDDQHDPPRWVRVEGLRVIRYGATLGGGYGLVIGLGIGAIAMLATKTNQNTVPLWLIGAGIGIFVAACACGLFLGFRMLKNADAKELDQLTEPGLSTHRQAILVSLCNRNPKRQGSNKLFNVDAFIDAYQSIGVEQPRALIVGDPALKVEPAGPLSPQQVVGDPPIRMRDSKSFQLLATIPLIIVCLMLITTLLTMGASAAQWAMFMPVLLLLAAQPFIFDLEMRIIFPRRSAILAHGEIEYRKRFRRSSITASDAVCLLNVGPRKSSVEWHRIGMRMPAFTLFVGGADDPRLQTLLSLWTADPLPETAHSHV